MSAEPLSSARELIRKYAHLFAPGDPKLQPVTTVRCDIETLPDQKPLASSPFVLAESNRQFLQDTVKDLLNKRLFDVRHHLGIARGDSQKKIHSTGEWSKKRFCVAYVRAVTKRDRYPFPKIGTC